MAGAMQAEMATETEAHWRARLDEAEARLEEVEAQAEARVRAAEESAFDAGAAHIKEAMEEQQEELCERIQELTQQQQQQQQQPQQQQSQPRQPQQPRQQPQQPQQPQPQQPQPQQQQGAAEAQGGSAAQIVELEARLECTTAQLASTDAQLGSASEQLEAVMARLVESEVKYDNVEAKYRALLEARLADATVAPTAPRRAAHSLQADGESAGVVTRGVEYEAHAPQEPHPPRTASSAPASVDGDGGAAESFLPPIVARGPARSIQQPPRSPRLQAVQQRPEEGLVGQAPQRRQAPAQSRRPPLQPACMQVGDLNSEAPPPSDASAWSVERKSAHAAGLRLRVANAQPKPALGRGSEAHGGALTFGKDGKPRPLKLKAGGTTRPAPLHRTSHSEPPPPQARAPMPGARGQVLKPPIGASAGELLVWKKQHGVA